MATTEAIDVVGQGVEKTLSDEDGVTHRGGLDGVGKQNAGMQLVSKGQVVRNDQVNDRS